MKIVYSWLENKDNIFMLEESRDLIKKITKKVNYIHNKAPLIDTAYNKDIILYASIVEEDKLLIHKHEINNEKIFTINYKYFTWLDIRD